MIKCSFHCDVGCSIMGFGSCFFMGIMCGCGVGFLC